MNGCIAKSTINLNPTVIASLDSLRADAIFGLRQLRKNKITSTIGVKPGRDAASPG